ncbi:MAG TPA: matrixin family metalloprotease [Vulgatibacter sp.]|nr:matrixin family metalloprotease [Vulgatibacter sp.]
MRRIAATSSLFAPALLALALLLPSKASAFQFISTLGCGPGVGAAWDGSTTWHLNTNGYSRIPFSSVQAAIEAGVEAWSGPCCSSFESEYGGTTIDTALDRSSRNVVSFIESNWPRELGGRRSTIAVTLTQFRPTCGIASADMVFNGVGFTFRIGSDTDLQAIATHEFGHWLGLDHTGVDGSTMLPYYQGGTTGRELGPDDEAGVCALYPGWCESCVEDADCPSGRRCEDGACVIPSCASNSDCEAGFFCLSGSCLPGCRTHLECGEEQWCDGGRCRNKPTGCTICDECVRDSDCGAGSAYWCVDVGMGSNVCTKTCNTDDDCDGDSSCYEVGSGRFKLCFAPGLENGSDACPANYLCRTEEPPPPLDCPRLWELCPTSGDGCGDRSDVCVPTGVNSSCSCTCRSDDECGFGAHCLTDPQTGTPVCFPEEEVEVCGNTHCPPGLACRDDACIPTCQGSLCERNEICVDDACVPACERCEEGTICDADSGTCVPVDRCAGVVCASDTRCVVGACLEGGVCENVSCPDGTTCRDDVCVKADASPEDDAGCSGCAAGDGALSLLGALALGAAALRRRLPRDVSRQRP